MRGRDSYGLYQYNKGEGRYSEGGYRGRGKHIEGRYNGFQARNKQIRGCKSGRHAI